MVNAKTNPINIVNRFFCQILFFISELEFLHNIKILSDSRLYNTNSAWCDIGHCVKNNGEQGPIYLKIPPPLGGGGKYQPMSFGGKNLKKQKEKGGKCKRKRKKGGRKGEERGKKMRKGEVKG